MTALSDLLNAVNHGLSARELARRAQDAGMRMSHDTAAKYLRGDHGAPDEQTLAAFAKILPIPLAHLRRAAGLPYDRTDPYVPPPEASRMSLRQRRAVDEIIRAMVPPAAQTASGADYDPEKAKRRVSARLRGKSARDVLAVINAETVEDDPDGMTPDQLRQLAKDMEARHGASPTGDPRDVVFEDAADSESVEESTEDRQGR